MWAQSFQDHWQTFLWDKVWLEAVETAVAAAAEEPSAAVVAFWQ